jgi:hypothetical protein
MDRADAVSCVDRHRDGVPHVKQGRDLDALWRDERGLAGARVEVSQDVLAQRIEDEVVIVHMGTNQIYKLNRSAGRLWELLDAGRDLLEARTQLLEEYDVSEAVLDHDIRETLSSLLDKRVITIAPAEPP